MDDLPNSITWMDDLPHLHYLDGRPSQLHYLDGQLSLPALPGWRSFTARSTRIDNLRCLVYSNCLDNLDGQPSLSLI
eukprot:1272268-Karenia_brevis.AAC.1